MDLLKTGKVGMVSEGISEVVSGKREGEAKSALLMVASAKSKVGMGAAEGKSASESVISEGICGLGYGQGMEIE